MHTLSVASLLSLLVTCRDNLADPRFAANARALLPAVVAELHKRGITQDNGALLVA